MRKKNERCCSKLYRIWAAMKQRCDNQKNPAYANYGGRGISVCERWSESFEDWKDDMGPRPAGLTLERIDNDCDYEPGNCKWASRKDQARNRRTTRLLTLDGRTMPALDWAREFGVDPATMAQRLQRGWTLRKALTTGAYEAPEMRADLRRLTHDGRTLSTKQWAEETEIKEAGITYAMLIQRMAKGWPVGRTLTTPPIPRAERGAFKLPELLEANHAS